MSDLDKLRRRHVYPGHPITIALMILNLYPTLHAAGERKGDFPAALGDGRIPGAGGNVHTALDTLHQVAKGTSIDEVLVDADERWANCDDQRERHVDRWRAGQEQADGLKDEFRRLCVEKPEFWSAPV